MTNNNEPDRAADIAWTIIKVIVNLIRFLIGGWFTFAFIVSLFGLAHGWAGLGSSLLFAFAAFLIWPQKYGPATQLIESYRGQKPQPAPSASPAAPTNNAL